jgi:hypothetical protein
VKPSWLHRGWAEENFKRRRQSEVKHDRIAMLTTMGNITPAITDKLPGFLSPSARLKFADVPNGLAGMSQDDSAGTAAASGDFGFLAEVALP